MSRSQNRWVAIAMACVMGLAVPAFADDLSDAVQRFEEEKLQNDLRNARIEKERLEMLEQLGNDGNRLIRTTRTRADIAVIPTSVNWTVIPGTPARMKVYCEAKNNGQEVMSYVLMHCVALDAQCKLIGANITNGRSSSSHRGNSSTKTIQSSVQDYGLKPGETGVFTFYVDLDSTSVNSVQFYVDGGSWGGLFPMLSQVVPNGSLTYQQDTSGDVKVSGQLKNTGVIPASNIDLMIIAKDSTGKVIDTNYPSRVISTIAAGGTADFSQTFYGITYSTDHTYEHRLFWDETGAANAGADQIVASSVTLDGSGSYAFPVRAEPTYSWQLTHRADSAYNRTGTGKTLTVSDLMTGFYNVTLSLTDPNGYTWTDSMEIVAAGGLYNIGGGTIGLPEAIHALQIVAGVK